MRRGLPNRGCVYALPPADVLMRKLRALLTTYREAGGERAIVLLHDDPHGAPLIHALARFATAAGKRAALAVNEVTQVGLGSHRRSLFLRRVRVASPVARQATS